MRAQGALGAALVLCSVVVAEGAVAAESRERRLTTDEIERWLDAEPGSPTAEPDRGPEDEEPLPAPRRHGVVVESGIGALNHIGALRHVTPLAPWFQIRVGYEPFPWLMPFIEADASFGTTAYASPPPPPRSYWHYGAGAGLRLTLSISEFFGVLAQASVGLAQISEQNVLSIYGFPDADEPNLYAGGELGLEWYPANPHLAVGVRGGLRTYGAGLSREQGGEPPLAALASAQIRYAF